MVEDSMEEPWETLPAWCYDNRDFFLNERERIFLRSWQLIGHVSEVAEPADHLRFDLLDQTAIVVRSQDGVIRAFDSVCRHRACHGNGYLSRKEARLKLLQDEIRARISGALQPETPTPLGARAAAPSA